MASLVTKFLIGSVVAAGFGQYVGSNIPIVMPNDHDPAAAQTHASRSPTAAAKTETGIALSAASAPSQSVKAEPARVGRTGLEQAILDAFPTTAPKSRKARKTAANASDFVGYTINANGYLCAKPIEGRRVDNTFYGVQCIMYRSGNGVANYLLNTRTNEVTEI